MNNTEWYVGWWIHSPVLVKCRGLLMMWSQEQKREVYMQQGPVLVMCGTCYDVVTRTKHEVYMLQGPVLVKCRGLLMMWSQEQNREVYTLQGPVLFSSLIYPLTARVVGAPQMILQPVFSIFPCSPLPSGTWRTPGLSIPRCCLPTSSSVCFVFFPLSLCLARWFWADDEQET